MKHERIGVRGLTVDLYLGEGNPPELADFWVKNLASLVSSIAEVVGKHEIEIRAFKDRKGAEEFIANLVGSRGRVVEGQTTVIIPRGVKGSTVILIGEGWLRRDRKLWRAILLEALLLATLRRGGKLPIPAKYEKLEQVTGVSGVAMSLSTLTFLIAEKVVVSKLAVKAGLGDVYKLQVLDSLNWRVKEVKKDVVLRLWKVFDPLTICEHVLAYLAGLIVALPYLGDEDVEKLARELVDSVSDAFKPVFLNILERAGEILRMDVKEVAEVLAQSVVETVFKVMQTS